MVADSCIGGGLWLLGCIEVNKYTWTANMLLISFSVYVFLVALLNHSKSIGRMANSLSKQSFSIYLLHQFCINIMLGHIALGRMNFYLAFSVLFVMAFIVPWIVAEMYDVLKRKYDSVGF